MSLLDLPFIPVLPTPGRRASEPFLILQSTPSTLEIDVANEKPPAARNAEDNVHIDDENDDENEDVNDDDEAVGGVGLIRRCRDAHSEPATREGCLRREPPQEVRRQPPRERARRASDAGLWMPVSAPHLARTRALRSPSCRHVLASRTSSLHGKGGGRGFNSTRRAGHPRVAKARHSRNVGWNRRTPRLRQADA